MKNIFEKLKNKLNKKSETKVEDNLKVSEKEATKPKKKNGVLRPALVCLAVFTLICGIIYPVSVTLTAQTMFPYEANGSVIEVTLADGTKRVFGSELIGQSYEDPKYMFGRVNAGSPSNLSPHSEEFEKLVSERVAERKSKLQAIGYTETENIPDELLTSSGSGVDPHISPETAYFQVPVIVEARRQLGEDITEEKVNEIIERYTEHKFLGMFGEDRVNVLLVNLALDGLL